MKKLQRLLLLLIFLIFLALYPTSIQAQSSTGCTVVDNTASCPSDKPSKQQIDFNFKTGPNGGPFDSVDPQCTSPKAASGSIKTVCCASPMEANSMDSVRAPLCGASQELSNGNSICWGCGGYFYCSGGSFTLAGSEPELDKHRNDGFYQLSPTELSAIRSRGSSFVYNGLQYKLDPNVVSIGICGSNVKACLTPNFNSCTNLATDQNAPQSTIYPKPTPPTPQAFNAAKQEQARLLKGQAGKPMYLVTNINTITAGEHLSLKSIPLKFLGAFGGGSIANSIYRDYATKIKYADNNHMMSNLIAFALKYEKFINIMSDIKPWAQKSMPYEDGKLEQNLMPWDTGWRLCVPDGLITRWDGTQANNTVLRGLTKSLKYIFQNNPLCPFCWYKAVVYSQLSNTLVNSAQAKSTNFHTPSADPVPVKAVPDGNDIFFDTKGQEALLDKLLPKCDDISQGQKYSQAKTTAAGKAITDGSGSGSKDSGGESAGSLIVEFLSSVWQPRLTPCGNDENDKNTAGCAEDVPILVGGDVAVGQGSFESHTLGNIASDFQGANAPAEDLKNMLRQGGNNANENAKFRAGFYNHWLDIKNIDKITKPRVNAEATQLQTINSGSSESTGDKPVKRESYPAIIKSVVDTDQCAQKLLLDIRYSRRNNVICPQIDNQEPYDTTPDRPIAVWQGAPNPLPASFNPTAVFSGDVKKAIEGATNGEIPACVLEAVKYIETGGQTNFSGECKINACSAAGPFQVTVGVDSSGDKHCRQCSDTFRAKYDAWVNDKDNDPDTNPEPKCPDGWPNNWPTDPSASSPCDDMNAAAKRAVQMLQQKASYRCETLDNRPASQQREAIITAGNSYYGSSRNEPRLDNCSYGEFVYKHCDGSYVCGTANVDLQQKYEQCQNQRNL